MAGASADIVLDEADEALSQALKVRDHMEFGGLELGPRLDAADTRDLMGQLREAQGRWEDAKSVRRSGAEKGETMCGSLKVSHEQWLSLFRRYVRGK